jgi:uncharacterized surface protein with fasciclin (FAS1) repeats
MNMKDIKMIGQMLVCLCVALYSCSEELPDGKLYITEDQQQISAFLEERPDMTITTEVLKRSGYYNLFNSYGRYTFFAPTDDAWREYLTSAGKGSIDDLTDAQCVELFDFHALQTSVNLKAMRTGFFSYNDTTMSGIQHFVDLSGGYSNIVMNKTSRVEETVELPNGFVYSVSKVFTPRVANVYDYLEAEGYSIFAQAVEAVGLKDTLQRTKWYILNSPRWLQHRYTVFAEPDEVFRKAGINSLEQLKEAVWNRNGGDDADADAALKEFIRYHILFLWDWYVDQVNQKLTPTLFNRENLRTNAHDKSRVIGVTPSDPANPDPLLNGSVKLNLLRSDVGFKNGVVHELADVLYLSKDIPQCTYTFECAEVGRDVITSYIVSAGMISSTSEWVLYDAGYDQKRGEFRIDANVNFSSSAYDIYASGYAFYAIPSERGYWVEFYLRNVPAGKYEVYLNYRRIKNTVSENVNAYMRKFGDAYDYTTQKLNRTVLNMSQDEKTVNGVAVLVPEFNQNVLLGTAFRHQEVGGQTEKVEELEAGDYVIRFVHSDMKPAYYDNIILKLVE